MLLDQDSGRQALPVVAGQHRHRRLGQDQAGIHLLAHQVGGAARQGHPRRQGLAHPIEAAKAGQQGGMDVHQALGVGGNQVRGNDAHPASHHHQVHLRRPQFRHQGGIQGFAAGKAAVIHQGAGYGQPGGPCPGWAAGIVDQQQHHLGGQATAAASLHQGFKVAAVARGHHPEPQPPARAYAVRGAGLRGAGLRCVGIRGAGISEGGVRVDGASVDGVSVDWAGKGSASSGGDGVGRVRGRR